MATSVKRVFMRWCPNFTKWQLLSYRVITEIKTDLFADAYGSSPIKLPIQPITDGYLLALPEPVQALYTYDVWFFNAAHLKFYNQCNGQTTANPRVVRLFCSNFLTLLNTITETDTPFQSHHSFCNMLFFWNRLDCNIYTCMLWF